MCVRVVSTKCRVCLMPTWRNKMTEEQLQAILEYHKKHRKEVKNTIMLDENKNHQNPD
jgi:hypothetical protein